MSIGKQIVLLLCICGGLIGVIAYLISTDPPPEKPTPAEVQEVQAEA